MSVNVVVSYPEEEADAVLEHRVEVYARAHEGEPTGDSVGLGSRDLYFEFPTWVHRDAFVLDVDHLPIAVYEDDE